MNHPKVDVEISLGHRQHVQGATKSGEMKRTSAAPQIKATWGLFLILGLSSEGPLRRLTVSGLRAAVTCDPPGQVPGKPRKLETLHPEAARLNL